MKAQLSIINAKSNAWKSVCMRGLLDLGIINCNSIKLHLDISTSLFLPFFSSICCYYVILKNKLQPCQKLDYKARACFLPTLTYNAKLQEFGGSTKL